MKKTNLTTKILLIFIIAMVFFVGTACASTITNSEVDNTNVYGSTAYYDISASSSSGSTATNIVHISGEYIYIEGLTASPTQGSIGETITFTPVNRRGAAVYLTNGTIVEGIEMSYGAGGTMVGTNVFTASYSTNGEKTPSLTLKGYDGTNIVTLNPVTTTVKIGFITALTVNGDTVPVYVGYNQTANVSVTASGTGLTYHWYATTTPSVSSSWSDSYFASPTSASTTFSTNSGAGAYSIKVVVSNGTMSEDSYDSQAFQRTINVVAPPTVEQPTISATTTPTTNTSLNGTLQKTFYVSVAPTSSTYGTVSYQWYEGENAITGLTGYSNQSITVNDSTNTTHTYHVVVTVKDAGGTTLNTVTSNNVTYNSFAVPQFESTPITTSTNVIEYDVDPTATLTAHATSGQGDSLKYNWEYNYNQTQWESFGTPDNPSNTVVFDATGLNFGTYQFRVTVSGYGGSVTSTSPVTINVITTPPTVQQPTISATTTASTDTSLSGTLQNTFYVSVTPVTVSYGVVSYQWYEGNNPISGLTGYSNQSISVNDSTNTTHTYHVVVTVKDSYGTTLHTVTSNDVTYKSFAPPQFDNPNNPVTASTNTIVYDVDPTAVLTAHTLVAQGDSLKYNWQYNLNQTGWVDFGTADSPVNTVTFDATGLTLGTYQFRVTVTGYGGSINNNTHLVTINVVGAGASTAQPLLGAVNEEYQLSCTSLNYDSLYWYYSFNGSSYTRIDDSYNQKTYYYTPTQSGEYRFKAICTYGTEEVETDPSGLVYVVGKQTLNLSPNVLFVNDDLTVELSNPAYGIPSAVTPVVTWKLNGESVTLTTTQTTSRLITYSYTPTTRGSKTLQGTIVYTDSARGLSYTETVSASFTVYQTPTASVSPAEGGLSTNFNLTATNTDFGTITWQISSDNVTFTDISSPLAPSSSAFTYQPTQGMTAGTYYIRGYVQWTNPVESSYTNVSQIYLYAVPPTPTVLIDGQSSKTVLSSDDLSFALSLNNYSPVSGDSYSYVWKYSKDGGSQTTISTTTTPSASFDFSSLGLTAGTYDITVTVTGKGGSTTSNASKLYVIGLSNVTVSKDEMGITETASTSVQVSGISTVQYHWYAKLGSGEWSDTFFGNTAQSASATFTPTNAGIYTFKVVISGTFETLDSYTDAGITNVTTTVYNAPQTPTILIDGQSSKTILASAATSVALSIPNYPTPTGDSYSFVWKYSKNGGSQQTIATTTTASTTFALSSLGAGTYEINVTVTGKGGSTSSSVSAMLYLIGLSNLTISKTEMGMSESATTSVQVDGITNVQYHWYAKLNNSTSQWDDSYFGTSASSASGTFSASVAGTYVVKVVISGTFGTIDSYNDAGITNVLCTVYSPPPTPTVLIDGEMSKVLIASTSMSVNLSISNYAPPLGDSYTYTWKYSKDGGSQTLIGTTQIANTTFALSSLGLGAGTYDITVTVTGKGGSAVSSASKLYVVGITNLNVSQSSIGVGDSVGVSISVSGFSNVQYHWYQRVVGESQWVDNNFGSTSLSQSATFTPTTSGKYEFKVVVSGDFGSIDSYTQVGITTAICDVYYIPTIQNISVAREVDDHTPLPYSVRIGLDAHASISSYSWKYSTNNGTTWTEFGTTADGEHVFDAGVYQIKMVAQTNEGYTLTSEIFPLNVIEITMSASATEVSNTQVVTFSGTASNLIADKNYECILQISTDNVNWQNVGLSTTLSSNYSKNYVFTHTGTYYVRLHAWDNSEFDYYSYDNVVVSVVAPPEILVTINKTSGETAEEVTLTATINNSSGNLSYEWYYSTNNGSSWTATGNHNLTYTATPSGNPLTLYKVIASSTLYSNINSNVVGYIITSNLTPTTSASGIGTSSSDAYIIPLKTQFPYEIIDVFAISGGVGLVVTEHALYLIDGNIKEGTTNVLAMLPVSYGKIKSCKYYNEHLICQTTDGRIIIQTIVGSSNFGASMEILGYTGTVTDYDVSQANYMIACQGVGVYTYDINGDLQWFIEDTTSTTFAATKVSSDYNLEYVILAGSPSSTTLTAYTGESTKLTVEVPAGIQSIQTITYDVPKFIVVTNNNTLIYNYTLTVNTSGTNNFSFGNYVSVPYKLSALSSARNGSLFAGVLANTFYVVDANGSLVGTYPTSGTLTDSDLAKLTTNMAITGGVSGQVSILQNSGSWEGLQSFPMPNSTRSLSMADSATVFFAATPNTVYNAIQKSSSDDRETILTTTYYLKIAVYDANGNLMPNASVRVISVTGTSMYTTDSTGTVTIEVIPTRTYTVSLANGEDSKVYIADNYALQHLDLKYPKVVMTDKIVTNAYVTENKYLNVEFKNTGNTNMYNMTVKILDSNKNILFTETKVTNNYENTFTASHLSIDNKTFIVQINATPIGDYNNPIEKSFVLEIKNESSSGTITLGTIPLLPDSMDDKWKTLIFGGLIMIIGGLFSYNHSIRGCVLMAIIAAVMTFLGLLPISPVWIACMVVLAFLTLYAWASQNEG